MRKQNFLFEQAKNARDLLNEAVDLAMVIQDQEKKLVEKLRLIDAKRYYVRYGFNSLTGFCNIGLRFSKTQTQRIVTTVRRSIPTENLLSESQIEDRPTENITKFASLNGAQ